MKKLNKPQLALVIFLSLLVTAGALFIAFLRMSNRPPLTEKHHPKIRKGSQVDARWVASYYGTEAADGKKFVSPYGVALDDEKNIYITDTGNSRIVKLSPDGKVLKSLDKSSDKKIMLHLPLGLDIDKKNNLYVADKRLSKILIFDKDFKFKKALPEPFPILPVVSGKKLFVTTFSHISVYNLEGRLLFQWGKRGMNEGEFDFPNGLAVSKGKIYVSDGNNYRLQAFDLQGDFEWAVGKPVRDLSLSPPPFKTFDLPAGLVKDEEGYLYLVDTFDCSIRVLTPEGKEIAVIGDFGTVDGEFRYPHGIAYAGNRKFFIADRGNDRVQQLEIVFKNKGVIQKVQESLFMKWLRASREAATLLYGFIAALSLVLLVRYMGIRAARNK